MSESRRNNGLRTPTLPAVVLLVALVAIAALVIVSFRSYLLMPEVYYRWPSGECVRVDDPAADLEKRAPYTCANLPERHEQRWVR